MTMLHHKFSSLNDITGDIFGTLSPLISPPSAPPSPQNNQEEDQEYAKPFFIMDWFESFDETSLDHARRMLQSDHKPQEEDESSEKEIQCMRQPLELQEEAGSPSCAPHRKSSENASAVNVWNTRGMEKAQQGLWKDAINNWARALKVQKGKFGDMNEDVAQIYNNMGIALGKLHRYDCALDHLDRAYEIRYAIHGYYDLSVAATLHNAGNVVQREGDFARAIEYFHGARKIKERVLGGDHEQVAHEVKAIGHVYYQTLQYEEAWETYTEALKIFRKSGLSDNDQDITNTLLDISDVEHMLTRSKGFSSFRYALD